MRRVRTTAERLTPEQSEELTRSGRPRLPSGSGGKPERGYPGWIGKRKAPRKRWPKADQPKETRKRDRRRLAEGMRKQTGCAGGGTAKAAPKREVEASAQAIVKSQGSNRNLYPARPCCCPRQSQGGPPRTGGGSSFGSGGHGPGDRRKARTAPLDTALTQRDPEGDGEWTDEVHSSW
jgi:hypothetical protein